MRRFFIAGELAENMTVAGEDAHHILHVLRCRVGQEIVVVDSRRQVAAAEITAADDAVHLRLLRRLEADTEAPIALTLAQCLPKADKMDWIVQKAVELGVCRVRPLVSANCVVRYDAAKREARRKKWQRVADEAAKQCGRTALPQVLPIEDFSAFLEGILADEDVIFCYEGQKDCAIADALEHSRARKLTVLVGPEGGFTPEEEARCRAFGMRAVTMGPRILRAETAAIAALAVVMYHKGDLNGRG